MFGKKWPSYSEEEIQVVTQVLRSGKVNYWTGEQGKLFEQEYATYLGVPYTVAVANGTNALELCLYALGIGPGDEVIVPARTFIASASCVVKMGARPVVCDVDPVTQNLTPATIQPHVTSKTKAIICVHLGGWPCAMDELMLFAKQAGLYVIEDCAQAHGAMFKGQPVGSFGDMAAFSFCQDKIISTLGEGGLVATRNQAWWQKVWSYKDHGKGYETVYQKQHPPGFRWLHDGFGSNYRMTEAQAAVGRIQLRNLAKTRAQRQANAQILLEHLKDLAVIRCAPVSDSIEPAYYRFYGFVQTDYLKADWSRDRIMQAINAAGVTCLVGSCAEIYLEQAFVTHNFVPKERLRDAQLLGETSLAFLVDPIYTAEEMQKMALIVKNVLLTAQR